MIRNYIIKILPVLCIICISVSGCKSIAGLFIDNKSENIEEEQPVSDEMKIYYTDYNLNGLYFEKYSMVGVSNETKLYELIKALDRNPDNAEYKKTKPETVRIESYDFGQDDQLIIHFSHEYLEMDELQEILCRAAIVKTLCQLPNVSYVEFYVEDTPLMISEIPVGQMASTDFIDKTGTSSKFRQTVEIAIYLADISGEILKESSLVVESDGNLTVEELAVRQLINGPLDTQPDLRAVISEKTAINKIHSADGICYVDFNEEFLNKPENVSDEVAVYSVVNTLCELTDISKVKISVNGEEKKNYGSVRLNTLLSLKPELIELEKAGESD